MPAFEDQHLRSVRMASGRALGYVQPETASQVLCQLVDKHGWERLLDGEIGRKPLSSPYAGCQIATELGLVSMQLRTSDDAFAGDTTVAGRPATVVQGDNTVFTVALSDDTLRAAPRQYYPVRRLLELTVTGGDPEVRRDVGTRVLTKIVPRLVEDGEPLPDIDGQGRVRYVSTPVPGGDQFVDLPRPVQALALCTALSAEHGATDINVSDTGRCEIGIGQDAVQATADHLRYPLDYPDTIAGRPAKVLADPPVVTVRLRDDADVELFVSAADSVAVAEKLVPLLTGQG